MHAQKTGEKIELKSNGTEVTSDSNIKNGGYYKEKGTINKGVVSLVVLIKTDIPSCLSWKGKVPRQTPLKKAQHLRE